MLNCILIPLLLSSCGSWPVSANRLLSQGLFCNFEEPCAWRWTGFVVLSGSRVNASIFNATDRSTIDEISGPVTDFDGNPDGSFLYVAGGVGAGKAVELSSPWYQESGLNCRVSVALHMNNMEDANLKLMVETRNHTWVIMETLGDSHREWRILTQTVGKISQPFRLKWELLEGQKTPAHAAIDNLRLDQCLTEIPAELECSLIKRPFRCDDGKCLSRDQVCDINIDCPGGEDEDQDCDKLPVGARCNFENGWCNWSNSLKDELDWTRHNGTTPTGQTGPSLDNTFRNNTGMYLYVDMSGSKEIANKAILQSPKFPPPPSYHSNIASPYYNSCQIRFFYHLYGPHIGDLVVRVVEEDPRLRDGKEIPLWRENKNLGDIWQRAAVSLPRDMKYWYTVQFVAKRGLRFRGDTAIDDVSLSPECFGIGVPENETVDWPPENIMPEDLDFMRYTITTCGAKGRIGPSPRLCERYYRGSPTHVHVLDQGRLAGVQVWTVPKTTLYTIIARGANGGIGSSGVANSVASHGTTVRAVVPLTAGTQLYFLVGQEGISASKEKIKGRLVRDVYSAPDILPESRRGVDKIRKAKYSATSGGGGGGATFVFTLDDQGLPVPLLVAGGGGGIGGSELHPSYDVTDAKGFNSSLPSLTGRGHPKGAGPGGGWKGNHDVETSGLALMEGGLGGYACNDTGDWTAHGGFGGGGGACFAGGGGGGYSGGFSYLEANKSGEGGSSFVTPDALEWSVQVETGQHSGPGSVDVLPAVSEGCDCSFLCVTLDVAVTDTLCVCPNHLPEESGDGCSSLDTSHLIGVIAAVVFVCLTVGLIFSFLYNRYQRKKLAALRRKAMAVPELQLSRLRGTSSGMVTEYNPNYEFGTAGPGSVQDLKDIPRENLRLVRALGQGAFGEVYQGYLRHVAGDSVEMPVAVKTLPELSSNQAEMDFLMEALIMSKFHHPNIVHFIGVCFDKHPRFIVLELLSGGDLKTFLRDSRPKPDRPSAINMRDLLKCALDVAKGCRYLEENHFIHRDIAARNCLLTTKGPGRVVKIADFGMARDIYRADYYRKGGKAMLPVKWMPPEAFLDGIFTSKTDVWSFGVLLWEVMSLGYMPYPGRGNQEVMQLVTNGGRLEAPPGCPAAVHRVMTQCWHSNPDERPCFVTILERIGYCMQDPDVLATPLPVFHRHPSAERDTTVVRPPVGTDTNECLRVLRPFNASISHSTKPAQASHSSFQNSSSADYLIPLANSSAEDSNAALSRAERSGYWETSFTKEGVKALARGEPVPETVTPRTGSAHSSLRRAVPGKNLGLSQSQSTQPLIDNISPPDSPSAERGKMTADSGDSHEGSLPLDASVLCRQSYANIRVTGTPTRSSQKSLREHEISC